MHFYSRSALSVIEIELQAIQSLTQRLDHRFEQACQLMLNCQGRVITFGVGKSGHIANKIAATLASTGTPAFFIHPSEAGHGDMGMVTNDDVILLLSNSGTTHEIVTLLPLFKRMSLPIIALLGKINSILAENATVTLDASVELEACPLGLAPTSSTTAALVMGDAIAIALLKARNFSKTDYAHSHPSGVLGRKLLLQVQDVMHTGSAIPSVPHNASFKEIICTMTEKKLGMTTVVDPNGLLCGIITDGDLRRTFEKEVNFNNITAQAIQNHAVKTILKTQLAAEALQYMQQHKITALVIQSDHQKTIEGVLHIHDLLNSGIL